MQHTYMKLLAALLLSGSQLFAQETIKEEKKEIIIEKKSGGTSDRMVIEIDGDKVTINGKPSSEFKGKNRIVIDEDIIINGERVVIPRRGTITVNGNMYGNRPLLGVVSVKDDKGAKIESVTEESGAEKAGLKKADVITKIGDKVITSPEDLSEAITAREPGDEVEITYLRDGKSQKVKAKIGKSGATSFNWNENNRYDFDSDMFSFSVPGMPALPRTPRAPFLYENDGRALVWAGSQPKYGMSIQDDEDGRGALVTAVEDESNAAKGGLQKDDIITEIDGTKVTGIDQVKSMLAEKKENPSVAVKVLRNGSPVTINVKVPRRIKSANL